MCCDGRQTRGLLLHDMWCHRLQRPRRRMCGGQAHVVLGPPAALQDSAPATRTHTAKGRGVLWAALSGALTRVDSARGLLHHRRTIHGSVHKMITGTFLCVFSGITINPKHTMGWRLSSQVPASATIVSFVDCCKRQLIMRPFARCCQASLQPPIPTHSNPRWHTPRPPSTTTSTPEPHHNNPPTHPRTPTRVCGCLVRGGRRGCAQM